MVLNSPATGQFKKFLLLIRLAFTWHILSYALTMKPFIKYLISALVFLCLALSIDQFICNKWVYHDYATGMDRKLACFWKP